MVVLCGIAAVTSLADPSPELAGGDLSVILPLPGSGLPGGDAASILSDAAELAARTPSGTCFNDDAAGPASNDGSTSWGLVP